MAAKRIRLDNSKLVEFLTKNLEFLESVQFKKEDVYTLINENKKLILEAMLQLSQEDFNQDSDLEVEIVTSRKMPLWKPMDLEQQNEEIHLTQTHGFDFNRLLKVSGLNHIAKNIFKNFGAKDMANWRKVSRSSKHLNLILKV